MGSEESMAVKRSFNAKAVAEDSERNVFLSLIRSVPSTIPEIHRPHMEKLITDATLQQLYWIVQECDRVIGALEIMVAPKMPKIQSPRATLSQEERHTIGVQLRYDILRKDGFKCRLCGYGVSDGRRLQVDHIIPFSKGGKTSVRNLRTLCEECNYGKANKIEFHED